MVSRNLDINPFDDIKFNVHKVLHYLSLMSSMDGNGNFSDFEQYYNVCTFTVRSGNIEAYYIGGDMFADSFSFSVKDNNGNIIFSTSLKIDENNPTRCVATIEHNFTELSMKTPHCTFKFDSSNFGYLKGKKMLKLFKLAKRVISSAVKSMKE